MIPRFPHGLIGHTRVHNGHTRGHALVIHAEQAYRIVMDNNNIGEGSLADNADERARSERFDAISAAYIAVTGADGGDWNPERTLLALEQLWENARMARADCGACSSHAVESQYK